ncbi:MAG: cell division protein FtsW [Phycisphaerae bacterium]|nr:cell division protein FtsW [Phycisphaerae bacterium]
MADNPRMLRSGDGIILSVFGLLAIGVVMVNSADLTIDPSQAVTFQSIALSRATLYMAVAVAAMLLVGRMPIARIAASERFFATIPWLFPVLIGVLLLSYLPGIGHEVNGARRWIRIPGIPGNGFTMQPSEIAKWGIILVLAWHCVRRAGVMHRFDSGLLPGLAMIGVIAALVSHQDLGTGVLIGLSGCLLLVAAGGRLVQLLAFVPLGLIGFIIAVRAEPYRMRRIDTFLNPYLDPEGAGYHMIQSLVAVANGKGFGRGLGFGLQKFGYLPEDRTDFLFAVICEELGLAGAALVIALYVYLLWSIVSIVRRETSPLLKLVGLGIGATLGLQALINLAVVTGLAPTKGIALPLLSYGGTGWILTAASLGVLVAMDRAQSLAHPAAPAERSDPIETGADAGDMSHQALARTG